jgi:chorismate dehydratase
MPTERLSASSYSNTAPLIWSFLYGSQKGRFELILDNAPARSAELLLRNRVDAALVPVIAYQSIEGARLVRNVCVGAREKVRSVCLVTRGCDLEQVKNVSLDISSRTSVVLSKIIFREFLGVEPSYSSSAPDVESMLSGADAALLIGDPSLTLDTQKYRKFDLAETWRKFTGAGFVFAMWMTRRQKLEIDFAGARDEGLRHVEEIISNYENEIPLDRGDFKHYLTENISYSVDDSMESGMRLFFRLACKHGLTETDRPLEFI